MRASSINVTGLEGSAASTERGATILKNLLLDTNRERLAHALESLAEGLLVLNRSGRCTYANAAAQRILGVGRMSIVEESCPPPGWRMETLDGTPLAAEENPFVRVRDTGKPVADEEFAVIRPDGTRLTLSAGATPLRDESGAFDGVVAVFSDIGDRKRAEDALVRLRESETARRRDEENAQMLRAQLDIFAQENLSGLLAATTVVGRRLGISVRIGCLLRDPGLDAWYLTAMLDSDGRAVDLASLDVPLGPFVLRVPESAAPRPLGTLMHGAWTSDALARMEQTLGTTTALCIPIPGLGQPRGALLALLPDASQAVVIGGVLAHAASAAVRHIGNETPFKSDGVLPPSEFVERATDEILRAERYGRPLSVVVFEADRLDELAQLGREIAPGLRRWDLLGRLTVDRPAIAAVLPETPRAGARGLIERLSDDLLGVRTGAASFPDDGAGLTRLVDVARGRAVRLRGPAVERWTTPMDNSRIWHRGAPSGADAYVVRCPICLVPYTRRVRSTTDARSLESAWSAARDALQSSCPCHPDEMIV